MPRPDSNCEEKKKNLLSGMYDSALGKNLGFASGIPLNTMEGKLKDTQLDHS